MGPINIKKITAMLIAVLALSSFELMAQDKIIFTWSSPGNQGVWLTIPMGEKVIIDWGDAIIETKTRDELNKGVYHSYNIAGEYTVTITAESADCRFIRLNCPGLFQSHNGWTYSTISNLSVANCSSLEYIYCPYNQIQTIDLTGCSALLQVECFCNRLQLSDLYTIHLLISDPYKKNLGGQNLLLQVVNIGEDLFSQQSVFEDIFTKYSVQKDGNPAPESDYTIVDGKITFNSEGDYTVTMTNKAIVDCFSDSKDPAVTVPIEVRPLGISENNLSSIKVYPNPTSGELRVTSNGLQVTGMEILDINGRKQQVTSKKQNIEGEMVINISCLPAGIYFVKIITEQGDIVRKIVKQ